MKKAYYVNLKTLGINCLTSEGPFPAGKNIKLPFPLALLFVAIMGAALVVFLPVIGFGLVLYGMSLRTISHFKKWDRRESNPQLSG